MTISTEPSTFEFARDWLVSSEAFVRDLMGVVVPDLDGARDAARARIHREEIEDAPEVEEAGETAPDLPPPVDDRPWAIIGTRSDTRRRVGTQTWAGEGELLIELEVNIPAEYIVGPDDTTASMVAKLKAVRLWVRQLSETIRKELLETSGQGAVDGTPYLNATDIDYEQTPNFPEDNDANPLGWMGWSYLVRWN